MRSGHEPIVIPLYLPLDPDAFAARSGPRVFMGAVSLYLSSIPGFRRIARATRGILDSSLSLSLAARLSGSTDPGKLGDLTLDMLRGTGDFLSRVEGEIISWLAKEGGFDAVHVSNALLLSIAGRIKSELGLPVLVSLQDEDSWINGLAPIDRSSAIEAIKEKSDSVDLFLPVSRYYARKAALDFGFPPEKMRVIHPGIPPSAEIRDREPGMSIGFMSRLSERLGFGIAARAFSILRGMPGLGRARLLAAGGSGAGDTAFIRSIKREFRAHGCREGLSILQARNASERANFLARCDVLSVPVPGGEAFGSFLLEAMAAGVPVVQPRAGGFIEVVEESGGGILVDDADPESLARALARVLTDGELRRRLASAGRAVVEEHFSSRTMADRTLDAYREAIALAKRR
jgi:glycosyltransferase involved in cell wall biosynthesis